MTVSHGSRLPHALLINATEEVRYADVMHEVQPVTSSYRLVIVYNLVQTSHGPMQSAAALLGERNELGQVFAAWDRGIKKGTNGEPSFLVYQLDHEYTEASLNVSSLKGFDKVKADCLVEMCSRTNVGFYLASCEKMERSGCESGGYGYDDDEAEDEDDEDRTGHHAIEDVIESNLELKRLVDVDGTLLAESIKLEEDDFVRDDPFVREPDHEDYQGYMGNWGPRCHPLLPRFGQD